MKLPQRLTLGLVCLFMIMNFSGYAQKTKSAKASDNTSHAKTEQEIKEVIMSETQAFLDNDLKAWSNCFIHSEDTMTLQKFANGDELVVKGFDQMKKKMAAYLSERKKASTEFTIGKRYDWHLKINGEMAWVTFQEDYQDHEQKGKSHEIRVLIKEAGSWKISLLSSIY